MKKNKLNYIVSIISSCIISCLVIPIKAIRGYGRKSFYGTSNIFTLLKSNVKGICLNCIDYKIIWILLILEIIIVFIISLIILNYIDKRRNKNG